MPVTEIHWRNVYLVIILNLEKSKSDLSYFCTTKNMVQTSTNLIKRLNVSIWSEIFIAFIALFCALKITEGKNSFSQFGFLENIYFLTFEFSYFFLISFAFGVFFSVVFFAVKNSRTFYLCLRLTNFLLIAYLLSDSFVFNPYRTHLI